jgi:RHS repeat-associated protein
VQIQTPQGTTDYLWCGNRICQSVNDATGAAEREYFAEGEWNATGQHIFYGPDGLGSIRDAYVAGIGAVQAYDYAPYGYPLQTPTTGPLAQFRFAGMFYDSSTGLYLTRTRAYSPRLGRWLSRDPLGEAADPAANLYRYVAGNPISNVDPLGLLTLQVGIAGGGTILGFIVPQGGFGVVIDTSGNIGTYGYSGIGAGIGVQAGVGGSIQFSNAQTIYDLSGPFANASANGGAGVGGSVDFFAGSSPNGEVTGGGITFGASAGASASLITTGTEICGSQGCVGAPWPLVNPLDVSPTVTPTAGEGPCE